MEMLATRLTCALNLEHPILSAPMAFAAGGALAAAVTRAGGLGLIGGGYGDAAWLEQQFALAQGERVGVGFITWSLARQPSLLEGVLRHRPAAVMLSFGDPRPFADTVRQAGAVLICQCQDLSHARDAVEAGADVIVAQGAEAGGHGASRGTLSLVPEVADWLAAKAPDTFPDIVRELPWPPGFTVRIRRNAFTERWHGREDALAAAADEEGPRYKQAFEAGDPEHTAVWFGEAAGLVHSVQPAARIVEDTVQQALERLRARP